MRISFAGGGSDLKEYYLNYGGSVVSTSINKYIYLSMHPHFEQKGYLLKYSKTENITNIADIQHPIIRQIFSDYDISGVDFNSASDIPAGTGLGSSSCFTSGLIKLCNAYTSIYKSKEDIAAEACRVEIEDLNEPIGKQDQYSTAIGGLNYIKFNQDDTVTVEKILIRQDKKQQLQDSLMMFYLGETRSASKLLKKQGEITKTSQVAINNLHRMVKLSEDLNLDLQNSNIDTFGEILHTGWHYKKEIASAISNSKVDHFYELAMQHGASGGKLLGAGGGGFLLICAPLEKQAAIRNALSELKELDFKFDNSGTSVIHYND